MKTDKPKKYVAPEIRVIKVIVEKGFAITAVILDRKLDMMEKHQVDEEIVGW